MVIVNHSGREISETTTSDIRIRISPHQKTILKEMAENSGFKTISGYVRSKIFDGDLALHSKINKIILLLQKREAGEIKEK